MVGATTDGSKLFPLFSRIGEIGVPITLVFKKANGDPYLLAPLALKLPVKRFPTDTVNVFELIVGAGLTLTDVNKVKIDLSLANSNQRAETHFWRLYDSTNKHTMLNGYWRFHNGEFNGLDNDEENLFVVSSDDGEIEITVSQDSGSGDDPTACHLMDDYDASTNLFPETVGSGVAGAVRKGDIFPIGVPGTLKGQDEEPVYCPIGTMVMAFIDAPGQLGANFRIW